MIKRIKNFLHTGIIILIFILIGFGISFINSTIIQAPDISQNHWKPKEATMIYSENGKLLARLYKENRNYTPISKIPKKLQNAIISIEDNRFYEHSGIDIWGIIRALSVNIIHGNIIEGGSTITQQLVKNAFLTNERTFRRKIQEAYLAIQLEKRYTKKEILELYLNEIYLGHNTYGVQTAATYYFNKDLQDLTLTESALLAGLPKSPNQYSPYNNPKIAKQRRNIVLSQMAKYDYITKSKAAKLQQKPINLENGLQRKNPAPHFIRYIRKKLINMYGSQTVYTGGLRVYTSLNYDMQIKAQKTVKQAFKSYLPTIYRSEKQTPPQPQVALITIEPQTGHIKAMIGGRGKNDKYNRATQAYRQPGSAFKTFVYTRAIQENFSPNSTINDAPTAYRIGSKQKEVWMPHNYNDKYLGPTTLKVGLAKSINVMAVKLLKKVGIKDTIETAKKMGISSIIEKGRKNDCTLSLALGGLTKGVTPLEITSAYGILANQGIKVEPTAILKVYDKYGNTILKNDSSQKIVLDQKTTQSVNTMLKSVLSPDPQIWSTGQKASIGRPAAGKTGTTSNYTDAWFIGYTPNLVTGVWIGEDKPTRMKYKLQNNHTEIISSQEASKLWGDYMQQILKNEPISHFNSPTLKSKTTLEIKESNNRHNKNYLYYNVKANDTLSQIANRFNTTIKKLVKLNNIPNKNLIYPNQKIKIPF
ncbi:PBP1A family penicillin-binding protein [Sporohalobacter salinus]|uniref:PBP1A family penicillin-binding protein n=1 Tax=Sporohalobacter salinus TaxID=1494606 RepID=UPI001EF920AB|nr:PBP1A family penicillin-binding protein [Sporohalobacter salinus]MBM7623793.1 penicillin-binding protein 1A [Sporohalobacter salinus]